MKDISVNVGRGRPVQEGRGRPHISDAPAPDRGRQTSKGGPTQLDEGDGLTGQRVRAPDASLAVSVAVRTEGPGVMQAKVKGLASPSAEVEVHWQPDLQDRTIQGLTRFTPVSTPWAPTFEGAVEAARHVQPLPNLSPSVRQAERTFRAMVKKDPVALAEAYLTQAKVNQKRLRARTQAAIKEELSKELKGVDRSQPEALIVAAERALDQTSGLKAGSRAKLLQAFSTRIREGASLKEAAESLLATVHVPLKIETDEIKLMSPHFNGTRVNLGNSVYDGADATKIGPAVFNTALHPSATAIARIALELVLRETDGPLVVMAGGVAAGKGFAAKKANFDDSDAAVVFDPDGESSQTFIDTVEALAAEHGNEMRLVGVVTDPVAAWLRALNRSFEEGRTVSETAFSHSHSTGVENMITAADGLRERGHDVVLIDNNAWPKLYEGRPPPPMGLQETYGRIKDITDVLDQTGRVPDWVTKAFQKNEYMMEHVIRPLEQRMQDPRLLQERKAIFDSLKEDRSVFEYAHPKV